MCLSTKRPSSTLDAIHAILCIYVISGFIISTSSYSVNVSAPIFVDNQNETVMCQINNSVLNLGNCPSSVMPIEFLEILLTKNTTTTKLCVFRSFLNCARFSQDSIANSCGCYSDGSNIYIVNVTVTAERKKFDGAIIDCKPSCIDNNSSYPFQSLYNGIPIVFVPTTSQPTTTVTAPPPCDDNCTPSSKCPDWCIAVSVCVPVGGVVIITVTVIIIKKKKAKTQGSSVQDTKEMQDRTKHHGTENRPTPAQVGNNRTEESAQDTKEIQDKTKHLGTENSPEREKRRKKKKKKKTFQEVDGESVSRENKSTVNDHKAAQKSPNDNSVSVNENSPVTYNGELRRLPMPNIPHMTSVERNSTYFQSETPRKLPPLQPKAMIIP